jgi:signal transduction histidine kinase
VTVAVSHDDTGPSLVVSDEGPGISREDQDKLFQKFVQLSARPTAGEHSSGLGLTIVQAQVAALGATIICDSEPGRGTRFVVRFQRAPALHPVTATAAA